MINRLFHFITLALVLFPIDLSGQETDFQRRNLDSLYAAWVEDRLMIPVRLIRNPEATRVDWGLEENQDSLYLHRLQSIPSVVDLTYNAQVRKHIDLYVHQRSGQVEVMLGLAEYYFPIFEEILAAKGLPIELKYMPVIESGLNPVATSRVGAQGLWQFMYRTAKSYDLEINSFVDERWDPVRSSEAAISYLKDLYDIYGDWHLVIAAYNCGPGNVNKAIRRSGGKTNYWEIYYHLPKETRGYVPAFIAAIYAMNYHHAHGIVPAEIDLPIVSDTVWIYNDLHLNQVAEVMDLPIIMLEQLNPQYRRNIIPGTGTVHALRLPHDKTADFITLQDSIINYRRDFFFSQLNTTKSPSYARYIPDPPKGEYATIQYQVKPGDNLGFIAEWYDVGLSRLRYWNNIYGSTIRVGQKLTVYVPKSQETKYRRINEMSFAEKQAFNDSSN